jgi:hypothetical protein
MRVGFIRQLLWERYGPVWTAFAQGLELEVVFADLEDVKGQLAQTTDIPGLSFRLAVAEARALSSVDVLVAPDLNLSETVARGSGQDPWIASFPEMLQRVAGLPPVITVPARLEGSLEPLVLETLLSFKHDPARVRLVWERQQRNLKPKRYPEPRWTKLSGQKDVVAVIGQPWLVTARLWSPPESLVISQAQLNPTLLRDEAKRLEQRLIATDAETLGAAHYFNRKGSVDKLAMVVDRSSGADLWLEKQVKKIVTKPLEVLYLQDLVTEDSFAETLLPPILS